MMRLIVVSTLLFVNLILYSTIPTSVLCFQPATIKRTRIFSINSNNDSYYAAALYNRRYRLRRQQQQQQQHLNARNNYDDNIDDDDSDDFYYDNDDDNNRRQRRTNSNGNGNSNNNKYDWDMIDNLGNYRDRTGLDVPSSYGRRDGWRLPESVSKSLLAGVFVLGVGLGVTIDSQVNTNPKDLASRDAIDNAAPNPNLCASLGASAMAFDQRVFVSFNPFNVYVSQADVKPACVLREANVVPVLKARGLINDNEVRSCKQNMNTWAFVGSLDDTPQLSCVYKSQDAQNEFLSNPKVGIGEDYLDDRDMIKTGKIVKGTLTEGQKDMVRDLSSR
jgi:hypothetical protein